jgi:Spy/CpxP family protein refolding chaperone
MNEHTSNTATGSGTGSGATAESASREGRRRRRGLGVVTLLLAGGLAGAGIATAVGVLAHGGPGYGGKTWMHGEADRGGHRSGHRHHRGERMKDRTARMLSTVDATPEQQERVQSLLDGLFAQMGEMRGEARDLRRALMAELSGAEIDRAELERIRGEIVAGVEARSPAVFETMASLAETLTPAQRAAIARHMATRGGHR